MNDPIEKAKKMIASGNPNLMKIGNEILSKHKKDQSNFIAPVRDPNKTQERYSEDGKKLMRKEEVRVGKIKFIDDKLTSRDKRDLEIKNKILKNNLSIAPRNRPQTEFKNVSCHLCGKVERVHPIHTTNTEFYRCTECIKKMSRM